MQEFKVRINEHHGDNLIPLAFPDGWSVEEVGMGCNGSPPMADDEIRATLDDAVGAPNISEQARGKHGRIVVTCDDLSRPTPADRVFPFIIEQLHEAGVSGVQVFILGSFGCHNPMNLDAFARKLGDDAVARYDCVNHNPFGNFENLGRTSRGTPLLVNKEFASADLRICISGVKKHIWAGAGGGGKAVLPGVSSIDTIFYNHGVIEGHRPLNRRIWWIRENPERLDMQEAARMADLNVSVNCVYNDRCQLIGLAAGDVDDAWREAARACYAAHAWKRAGKADVVVVNTYLRLTRTSTGGAPRSYSGRGAPPWPSTTSRRETRSSTTGRSNLARRGTGCGATPTGGGPSSRLGTSSSTRIGCPGGTCSDTATGSSGRRAGMRC